MLTRTYHGCACYAAPSPPLPVHCKAVPMDSVHQEDQTRGGGNGLFRFENPTYDDGTTGQKARPSNGLSAESGTDGISNPMYGTSIAGGKAASGSTITKATLRNPRNATARAQNNTATNARDVGSTLSMMMLEQQVTFFKRAIAGLSLLSFVLLIGMISAFATRDGSVGICTASTAASAAEELGRAETALLAADAAAAAFATSFALSATTLPVTTSTVTTSTTSTTTLTVTTYDWGRDAAFWMENATQCSADLDAATTLASSNSKCCTDLQQFEDLAVGKQCRTGSECSGGRQCLGRCCVDGAGTNCISCGADGTCAACSPTFYANSVSGTCSPKFKDGEMGCSTAAECASGRACRGNVCCHEHGAAVGVVQCSTGTGPAAGNALKCVPGMYLDAGQCLAAKPAGNSCTVDHECLLGVCRGSICCNGFGQSTGCTSCEAGSGNCQQCSTTLNQAGFCAPPPPPPTSCPACPACPSPPPPPTPKPGGCGDERMEFIIPPGQSSGNMKLYGGICDSLVYCTGVVDGGTCRRSSKLGSSYPCHELTAQELTEPYGEHPYNPHCGTLREFTDDGCTHTLRKHRYCSIIAKCYGGKVVATGFTW